MCNLHSPGRLNSMCTIGGRKKRASEVGWANGKGHKIRSEVHGAGVGADG